MRRGIELKEDPCRVIGLIGGKLSVSCFVAFRVVKSSQAAPQRDAFSLPPATSQGTEVAKRIG